MDLYTLAKGLIDEARKQKNLELVEKLIDIKFAVSEFQEENDSLKKKLEVVDQVKRHDGGNDIT